MLLQVCWVLALEHRGTVAAAVHASHLADAHVGVGQVFKMFPYGAAATSSDVLGIPASHDAAGQRVRNTQSVDFRMEALNVFL